MMDEKQNIKTTASIKTKNYTEWFVFGVCTLVILLFLYTGVNKLLEMKKFIFQMRLVPLPLLQKVAPLIGWAIPILEILIVLLLSWERTRKTGLYSSLLLMLSFEVYISWMKYSDLDLPCTCGGIISQMSWTTHFIFNAAVIVLITTALILHPKRLISIPV